LLHLLRKAADRRLLIFRIFQPIFKIKYSGQHYSFSHPWLRIEDLTETSNFCLYLCLPMFKIIIYGFLLYLLYKFIFELVIPVSKATSQVKDKLREMQEQQRQQQYTQQQATPPQQTQAPKNKDSDYIEFEELK
jgi:hypothetical protein